MKVLYLIRGLPGAGKSTLAKKLVDKKNHIEVDQYFVGEPRPTDKRKILEAYAQCVKDCEGRLKAGAEEVAVSNIFSAFDQMAPYFRIATVYEYAVQVVEVASPWRSTCSGVTAGEVEKLLRFWEPTTNNKKFPGFIRKEGVYEK